MQLKQHADGLSGWNHFKRAVTALLWPCLFALIRAFVTPIFDYIYSWNKARKMRLEADKKKILKELKVCGTESCS